MRSITEGSRTGKRGLRRVLLAGTAAIGLAVGLAFGWDYWTAGRFHVSTDNAYVQADNVTIAPKVPGYLAEVLVRDNQRVKAGQVLARIDDRDYRVALDQAKADVQAAVAVIESKKAALETQRLAERQGREILEQARNLGRKELEESRRKALQMGEDARKEAAASIAEARAVADAALEDAQRLRDALAKSTQALTGEAEQLVRDVQLAHRELLGSLRLPGVSERDAPRSKKPPSPDELFEPPDWIGPR